MNIAIVMSKTLWVLMLFSIICCAMDNRIEITNNEFSSSKEQYQTAPILDGMRILNFVTNGLPKDIQESFVEKITIDECVKIATNLRKDHAYLYEKAIKTIETDQLLSKEQKSEFLVQILAYGFMYRSVKSKKYKDQKNQSEKKALAAQKTSLGTFIVSSIITITTNLLQHFLTKK